MRTLILISALVLAGCGTPGFDFGGGGGAGAGTGDTTSKSIPIDAMIGINQPGGIDGVEQTRLGYTRSESGSQQAPAWALNLQSEGATGTANYPALANINVFWFNMQNNSQREGALDKDQIGAVAGVVTEAAAALEAANAGNSSAIIPIPAPLE